MTFNFTDSGPFIILVKPYGGTLEYEYDYTHNVKIGSRSLIIGDIYYTSGSFSIPILAKSTDVEIILKNTGYFPSNVHSAEWEGNFVMLTKRL